MACHYEWTPKKILLWWSMCSNLEANTIERAFVNTWRNLQFLCCDLWKHCHLNGDHEKSMIEFLNQTWMRQFSDRIQHSYVFIELELPTIRLWHTREMLVVLIFQNPENFSYYQHNFIYIRVLLAIERRVQLILVCIIVFG